MTGPLSVSAEVSPGAVCGYEAPTCVGVTNHTRVTLRVAAPPGHGNGTGTPNIQVLFAVETSMLDGACSPAGIAAWSYGSCLVAQYPPVTYDNISMFVADFIAHAGTMTSAVAAAHPGANVTFGLVDFQQAPSFDDGDGWIYHVDFGAFVNSSAFPTALNGSTFQDAFADIDLSDNLFRSSSITALYGALSGDGLNWSADAHHVIVWIGATAPIDPHYPINQCVGLYANSFTNCQAGTCEPSTSPAQFESPYNFSIPMCEGWVTPTNGTTNDSIASFASNSPACVNSVLNHCTIDTITLPSALTDPNSTTWGPSGANASYASRLQNNTKSVISAGCDLANATNGSWNGPQGVVCPGGATGTITTDLGNASARQAQNVSLIQAVGNISFGVNPGPTFGTALPGVALFTFVLAPGVRPAPVLNLTIGCTAPNGTALPCDSSVQVGTPGLATLSWNWSSQLAQNVLGWGDVWTASFDVVIDQSPNASVPIDVCTSTGCVAPGGSQPTSGVSYSLAGGGSPRFQSFPLIVVAVLPPPPLATYFASLTPVVDSGGSAEFSVGISQGVPPYQLAVDFGDGSQGEWTSVPSSIGHTYPSPGQYDAKATVVDANGTALTLGAFVTVLYPMAVSLVKPGPTVVTQTPSSFSLLVTGGLAPYNISWQFSDGSPVVTATGSSSQVVHTYVASGTYDGKVTVVDGTGAVTAASFVIQAISASNTSPPLPLSVAASAVNGAYVGNPCTHLGLSVTLAATASGGVGPYNFSWSFGDGTPIAFGATVQHVFPAGAYTAVITVTDAAGTTALSAVSGTSGGVAGPACSVSASPSGGWGAAEGPIVLLGLGIFAAIVVGVIVLARRRT